MQKSIKTSLVDANAPASVVTLPENVNAAMVPIAAADIQSTFRQADHLVIVLKNGGRVVIEDFFGTEGRTLVLRDPADGGVFEVSLDQDGAMIALQPRTLADIAEMFNATAEDVTALEAAYEAGPEATFYGEHVSMVENPGGGGASNALLIIGGLAAVGAIIAVAASGGDDDADRAEDDVNPAQSAINLIADYAETDGESTEPTLEHYTAADVTGVTEGNRDAVNAQVAAADRAGADSTDEIQALVARVEAIDVIADYAETDGESKEPTLADYTAADVTGVTERNRDAVNEAVSTTDRAGADTTEEIQRLVNLHNPDSETISFADQTTFVNASLDTGEVKLGEDANLNQALTDRIVDSTRNLTGTNFPDGDTLTGDENDNELLGRGGDDTLNGGAGADMLDGGDGNDTASYDGSDAGVTVDLDRTVAQDSVGDASGDILANIENLTGSEHDDTLTGDAGNNTLIGGDGDDTLIGGAGADELFGGKNTVGNSGGDTASYAGSSEGVKVSLVQGAENTGGDAQGDTLTEIENLTGSAQDDTLTGNMVSNRLSGGAGADTLSGGKGDDTLIGGAGRDRLRGGDGDDTADYSESAAGVRVNLQSNTAAGGDATGDRFDGIENLTGSEHNDRLTGNLSSNTLTGGAGDDTLRGGDGNDMLIGGAGNDTADYSDLDTGVTVNLSSRGAGASINEAGETVVRDDQENTLTSIENITGSRGNDTLTGDDGNNTLTGGAGDDRLNGGGGNDTLNGGAGDDRLNGGGGNDTLIGGAGADGLDGGTGTDTASYAGSAAGVTVTVNGAAAQNTGGDAAGDTLDNIENLIGSAHGDMLTGDRRANTLDGGAGNDTLNGGGGNDTLSGGAGDDRLSGNAGDDRFVFADDGAGNDTIVDFISGEDRIVFDTDEFSNQADVRSAMSLIGNNTVIERADDSTITVTGVNLTIESGVFEFVADPLSV